MCELLGSGMAGIFGPSSVATSEHVQAVCDTLEVPHIQTLFNPNLSRETCSINLYPHHSTFAEVRANTLADDAIFSPDILTLLTLTTSLPRFFCDWWTSTSGRTSRSFTRTMTAL